MNVVDRKDLDLKVFRMRRKGLDNSRIGKALGISTHEAKAACMRVLTEHAALSDEEIQAEKIMEVERCEMAVRTSHGMIEQFLPYVNGSKSRKVVNSHGDIEEIDGPDLDAANFIDRSLGTLMTIGKRKAALLGLDAPKEVPQVNTHQTINVNYVEQPIQRDSAGPTVTITADPCPVPQLLPPPEED